MIPGPQHTKEQCLEINGVKSEDTKPLSKSISLIKASDLKHLTLPHGKIYTWSGDYGNNVFLHRADTILLKTFVILNLNSQPNEKNITVQEFADLAIKFKDIYAINKLYESYKHTLGESQIQFGKEGLDFISYLTKHGSTDILLNKELNEELKTNVIEKQREQAYTLLLVLRRMKNPTIPKDVRNCIQEFTQYKTTLGAFKCK